MNAASSFAFLKKKVSQSLFGVEGDQCVMRPPKNDVDTNVISLAFDSLKTAEDNMQMGDACFCKHCKSCLTSTSKLWSKPEYQAKYLSSDNVQQNMEEEKKEQEGASNKQDKVITTDIADTDRVWICEFCGVHNLVNLDPEEVPKSDDVVYLLQSAQQISKNPSDLSSDITTIFCIDNSGSMSVTQEIKGKHDFKHGLSEEEYEMLKQFIENGADQYLPNQKKDTTFISRKQCVLAAIEDQLLALKNEYPNRKVGLVTFNSEVSVVGDGKHVPETITGDKLHKYDVLQQIGDDLGTRLVTSTIKDSAQDLLKKFESLKESGKTALGPALLISLYLAIRGKTGSRVILCTDGLANVGLGEMDTPEGLVKADEFYTQLANVAKDNGISISVISIKGEGCKLDILGKVADITSGSLTRVDPNEITGKFANIMKQEVIGTKVDVKLRLHQALKFRNEASEFLKEKDSLYEKNVGNVTADTELTFEYELRPDEELVERGIDMAKLERVPFQAQIIYTSSNGDRLMRVITKTLKTTQNLEEAEKHLNVNLLAARALQQQANFAAQGMFGMSNQVGENWGGYFGNRIANKAELKDHKIVDAYMSKNQQMQFVANKRSGGGGGLFSHAGPQGGGNQIQSGVLHGAGSFGAQPQMNQASTGSIFGGYPQQMSPVQNTGYFGAVPQNNQAPKSQSGSLFGSAPQQMSQPPTGGLFSAKPQMSQAPTGSLFGGYPQQMSQAQNTGFYGAGPQSYQVPSGSLFRGYPQQMSQAQNTGFYGAGSQSYQAPSGSLFGGGSNSMSQAQGTSLFGSAPQQTQNTGYFGAGQQMNDDLLFGGKEVKEKEADEEEDEEYELFHAAKNCNSKF